MEKIALIEESLDYITHEMKERELPRWRSHALEHKVDKIGREDNQTI